MKINEVFKTTHDGKSVLMTQKQHADIKRAMKANIVKLEKAFRIAQTALHDAQEKLKEHEKIHPKYQENIAKKAAKLGDYHETGRDSEPTPSGGMGGRY
jgi:hypothetical protein